MCGSHLFLFILPKILEHNNFNTDTLKGISHTTASRLWQYNIFTEHIGGHIGFLFIYKNISCTYLVLRCHFVPIPTIFKSNI